MIEYAKVILPKVSLWKQLFRKELFKCFKWTEWDELDELYYWCYKNFFKLYPDVLTEVFVDYAIEKKTEKVDDVLDYDFSIKNHNELITIE